MALKKEYQSSMVQIHENSNLWQMPNVTEKKNYKNQENLPRISSSMCMKKLLKKYNVEAKQGWKPCHYQIELLIKIIIKSGCQYNLAIMKQLWKT